MKRTILSLAIASTTLAASAITPLWLRDVKISPDGRQIAFTYKGDIYKVATEGGNATRLTALESYESTPIWSPDSKRIAFASDRYGGSDIFVMDANGGSATRLTFNSASETPETFSHDGRYVFFSAAIQDPAQSALFPTTHMSEVYRVPVNGGRTEMILGTPALMLNMSADGTWMLYQDQKGFEDEWRKHHTSSVTRDIWKYDFSTGKHTNLTDRAGEDRNPILSPDGNTIYILSERDGGSMNVYSFPIDNPQSAKAITSFKTHPVRFLSQGADGTLAFTYDGEIYTKQGNASPRKVKIDIVSDYDEPIQKLSVTSGLSEASVSPDGKQVALIKRGEIFVTSVEYTTTKQITSTAAAERHVAWGKDNRTLVYASERDGVINLYQAKIARKDDLNFPNATTIEEEALFKNDGHERAFPQFSPDGKQLAFIQDRQKLMVMDVDSRKTRLVTDKTYVERNGGFSFQWSPDSRWITSIITRNGHQPYSDIALIDVANGQVHNLTSSGYFDLEPRWVLDGNAILFITDRYGMRNHASWGSLNDMMLVFLNQDAYDKFRLSKEDYELRKELEKEQEKEADKNKDKKADSDKNKEDKEKKDDAKPIIVELDGIRDRLVRVTPASADIAGGIVTKDGETLYYLAAFEKGYDLWKIDLRKPGAKLVSKLDAGNMIIEMDKEGKNIYLLGASSIKKMDAKSEKMTPITYSATMRLDAAAEREYMFNYVYKEEKERFYVTDMHGVNWDALTKDYRRFLPHINNNYDFAELLSEWLGELNVSHTGGRYRSPGAVDKTASLGLLYDWTYTDDKGLRVDEIVAKGPFDHAKTKLTKGCIIEKINGNDITATDDYSTLLTDLAGKKTLISIYDPASGERWDEVILPISSSAMSNLLYTRWVKQREADVDRWSQGRLGYVHIQSMGDDSFRRIYTDILGKYCNREGIVIDTRWNGGGRLHEDIEVLFSGEKYFTQVIRGTEVCDMPSRRWNKPSIMVQCEANYSNAHGTPWVYSHRKLGKLVGMPVPGTMTSVNWVTLQDPSLIFGIPVVGYQLPDGSYLENSQLEPDVKVANDPATIVAGEDAQLRRAVEELLQQL